MSSAARSRWAPETAWLNIQLGGCGRHVAEVAGRVPEERRQALVEARDRVGGAGDGDASEREARQDEGHAPGVARERESERLEPDGHASTVH
jgi:hypothetical protein